HGPAGMALAQARQMGQNPILQLSHALALRRRNTRARGVPGAPMRNAFQHLEVQSGPLAVIELVERRMDLYREPMGAGYRLGRLARAAAWARLHRRDRLM